MGFGNEGWFLYWLYEELEEDEEQETYKRVSVIKDNEDVPCALCGEPLGKQGETALLKISSLFDFNILGEHEYICEQCKQKPL